MNNERPTSHRRVPSPSPWRGSRRWLLRGVRITAAVLSFAVLAGSGYAWASFRHFTSNVTHIDAIVAPGAGRSAPAKSDVDGADQNILLVGDDHRPPGASPALLKLLNTQQDGGGVNTDTMMVLHIPADGSKATVISFPRDSWVDIPGFGKGKLNSAFQDGTGNGGGDAGGAQLLIKTIQNMTGLTIDHFVRVSMVGFYDIAQVLGPIQVCLNEPAVDSYSGTNLPAGVSTLDAQQALSFVRQRHGLPRGDLDREVRQQYFLSTELRKVVSAGTLLNPFKLQSLLNSVSAALETDPGLNLLQFASQFQNLSAGNVTFATIPVTGTPTITDSNGNQVSIVAVDFAALPGFIAQVIGPSSAYRTATAAAPSSVSVQVVNATGTVGVAATNSAELNKLGFTTAAPTTADATTTTTTIAYPAGMQAQAKALAAVVPGATVYVSGTVSGVTLTLGTDGHQVSVGGATAAPSPPAPTTTATAPPAKSFTSTSCIN